MQQKQAHWLNTKDMAKSVGISPQAFDRWGVPSIAKIGRETFYTVEAVLENRRAHLEQRLNREREKAPVDGPTQAEMDQSILLLRQEQREKLALENANTRRDNAPVALIDWVLSRVGAQIGAILEAVPAKLRRRNPRLTAADIETVQHELVKASNACAGCRVDLDAYDRNAPSDTTGDSEGAGDT